MSQSIKLQINSREALERLIGGDSELEFEIRNSVARDFAERNIRNLVNAELKKELQTKVRTEIDKFFKDGTQWYDNRPIKENERKGIQSEVENAARGVIYEEANRILAEMPLIEMLNKRIQHAAEIVDTKITEAVLTKRIDELVEHRIKERLGLK